MKKRIKKNGIFYVAISLVAIFGIGLGINAYQASQVQNIETYNYYEAQGQPIQPTVEDVNIGGTIGSDVYNEVVFHDNTQIKRQDSSIDVELYLNASTTATTLRGIAAQYYNEDNDDLICDSNTLRVDFYDAVAGFGSNFTVGTTTRKDGRYLTATTAAQLIGSTYVGTTTQGLLIPQVVTDYNLSIIGADALGTYFSEVALGLSTTGSYATGTQPFILRNAEVLVVAYDYAGATSTDSWTNGAGATDTKPGRFHVNCNTRRGNN